MKQHFADIIECCQTSYLSAFEKIERKEVVFPSFDAVWIENIVLWFSF
jgi:hypothetical protein